MSPTPAARVRLMEPADVPAVADIWGACFGVDLATPERRERAAARVSFALATDPEGAFVATIDGRVVAVAQVGLRDGLWCLTLMAVEPSVQSLGVGRLLMDRALGYGAPLRRGLIVSSNDSRALRLYAAAGFSLRPTLRARGPVKRIARDWELPAVRDGDASDLERLARISRAVRGAAHTVDLEHALNLGAQLLVVDDRAFAAVSERGLIVLAALDDEAASALLWRALELAPDAPRPIGWITGGQDWAVRIAVLTGLELGGYGALCVLGEPGPLRPYIPNGSFA